MSFRDVVCDFGRGVSPSLSKSFCEAVRCAKTGAVFFELSDLMQKPGKRMFYLSEVSIFIGLILSLIFRGVISSGLGSMVEI